MYICLYSFTFQAIISMSIYWPNSWLNMDRHRCIYMMSALKKMKLAVCWLLVFFGLMMQAKMTTLILASNVSAWKFSITLQGLIPEVDWILANIAAGPVPSSSSRGQPYQRGWEKSLYCSQYIFMVAKHMLCLIIIVSSYGC